MRVVTSSRLLRRRLAGGMPVQFSIRAMAQSKAQLLQKAMSTPAAAFEANIKSKAEALGVQAMFAALSVASVTSAESKPASSATAKYGTAGTNVIDGDMIASPGGTAQAEDGVAAAGEKLRGWHSQMSRMKAGDVQRGAEQHLIGVVWQQGYMDLSVGLVP